MTETTTVLTLPDAERLAERTLATIHPDPGHYDDNEDRWQRAIADRERVASDLAGLRDHPAEHTCESREMTYWSSAEYPCPDARRYSDGLRRTGRLYGVEA